MKKAMTITYEVKDNLYVNITNKCPCSCTFCIRNHDDGAYGSDPLWLEHEPSFEEIREAFAKRDLSAYREIVFCGYGEPTTRLDMLIRSAEYLKSSGNYLLRLNTNGLSDLVNGRSTADELCRVFDSISISLNAGTKEEYLKVTRPSFKEAFEAMQKFTSDCVKCGNTKVIMTVVDVIGDSETEAARSVCEKLGAQFIVRKYDS